MKFGREVVCLVEALNQSVFKTQILHMSWTSALAVGPARRDRSHAATVKNVVTLQIQRQTSAQCYNRI